MLVKACLEEQARRRETGKRERARPGAGLRSRPSLDPLTMSSPPPQAGPSSARADDLERFWHPPPASSTAAVPTLRAKLAHLPSSPALRISRVAQLDASLLDGELENILHAPVKAALDGVRVRPTLSRSLSIGPG